MHHSWRKQGHVRATICMTAYIFRRCRGCSARMLWSVRRVAVGSCVGPGDAGSGNTHRTPSINTTPALAASLSIKATSRLTWKHQEEGTHRALVSPSQGDGLVAAFWLDENVHHSWRKQGHVRATNCGTAYSFHRCRWVPSAHVVLCCEMRCATAVECWTRTHTTD